MGFLDRMQDRMMQQVTGEDADPRPKVIVRHYKDAKAYERDAALMSSTGYHVQAEHAAQGKANVGRTVGKAVVFLPWALLRPSRQGERFTVTWVRD